MIKTINVDQMKAASYNPRKDLKPGDPEYEKLKVSFNEFGYIEPIIWNEQTGNVVGGHQRLKVLIEMGQTEVECVVVDFDLQKEKAANLALNKIKGEWDDEKVGTVLKDLEESGFNLDFTGFDAAEVAEFFKKDLADITNDDFDLDVAIDEINTPVTQIGDMWILGRHRLLCGDSANICNVNKLMSGQLADLVFTDPPYNVDYIGKSEKLKTKKIQNDKMDTESFCKFLTVVFANMALIMQPGAGYYICHPDSGSLYFRQAIAAAKLKLAQTIIYKKSQFVMGRQDYQWQHEPILYGWKEGAAHFFIKDRTQSTVWEFDKPIKANLHPTMKPVPLCAKALLNSCRRKGLVVDLFGGSGSTMIAAEDTVHQCYMMEIDPIFCDIIVKRWEEKTGHKAECLPAEDAEHVED